MKKHIIAMALMASLATGAMAADIFKDCHTVEVQHCTRFTLTVGPLTITYDVCDTPQTLYISPMR